MTLPVIPEITEHGDFRDAERILHIKLDDHNKLC